MASAGISTKTRAEYCYMKYRLSLRLGRYDEAWDWLQMAKAAALNV